MISGKIRLVFICTAWSFTQRAFGMLVVFCASFHTYMPTSNNKWSHQEDRWIFFKFTFCETFQNLYGTASCTINLHLHCHLAECLHDYGPAYDTWCFSFERLNGILGRMPSNIKQYYSLQIEKFWLQGLFSRLNLGGPFHCLQENYSNFFHLKKLVPSVKAALTQILM